MRNMLDSWLCRLPPSTSRWTCPWFRVIVFLSACFGTSGILSGTTIGICCSIACLWMAGLTVWHRFTPGADGERCGP